MCKERNLLALIFLVFLAFSSCQQKSSKVADSTLESVLEVELDTTSQMIKFDNTLFSLPSPHQLSILIKEIGANFNAELINPSKNYSQYTSIFKQAINLGIYGADLAYLNIYEQSPSAVTYFSVIKIMAQELDLIAAFSPTIFERIENNIDRQDSLLYIVSNLYSDVDLYLKESQRQREGVLILAGGWIEATYFLTNLAVETKNIKLVQRVGENKGSLENLIKLLSPYYSESEEVSKMVDELIDLAYDFDSIEVEYTYEEPTTYPENRLTQVHSQTKINISDDVLSIINTKIEKIRNDLIK